MRARRALRGSTIAMAVLLLVAFSPLTDDDSGWRNTVGDVVWTGMFLAFAGIIAAAVWVALDHRARAPRSDHPEQG